MPAVYPTASDLSAYLTAAGFPAATVTALTGQFAGMVAAGIGDFERTAGRKMLAGDSAPRIFGPPVNGTNYLPIPDCVAVSGVSYAPYGQTTPETYLASRDYTLGPVGAMAGGAVPGDPDYYPYQSINFLRGWWQPLYHGLSRSLTITGQWGYGVTIPDDAWQAMLAAAALRLFTLISHYETGGRLGYKEADVSEDFGVETWTRLRDGWKTEARETARRYRRWSI